MRKRKPHDNNYDFDTGRFGDSVKFYEMVSTGDGAGGTTIVEALRHTTRGAKELVSINSLSQAQQLGIISGVSEIGSAHYVFIRKQGFVPKKDMKVDVGGKRMVIHGVVEQGIPVKFYKILCLNSE